MAIEIFDTTLRDGEQTPGVSLNVQDKIAIANALNDLGVKIIEAGFPISSDGDFKAVKAVAELGIKSETCGLARCVEKDIDACIDAGVDWTHIFIGTSPLHREYKLKLSKEEILERAVSAIEYCTSRGGKVHFSPEDACRTEIEYLEDVCKVAQDAGADIINIPDTVGIMTPAGMYELITRLAKTIKVPIAVHCHNDFGLAVANTLEAIKAGATIPHTTINGLGERAGNADMEQLVMSVESLMGLKTRINKKKIYKTSKLAENLSGIRLPPNFPLVGDNAFAHESGIHVHGILSNAATYEPIDPEDIGARRRLVLGKHVGVHGVEKKLHEMKIDANSEEVSEITKRVKELADKRKKITEEDLLAIAQDVTGNVPKSKRLIELIDMELNKKLNKEPEVTIKLKIRGREKSASSKGVGPVDASLNAIKKAVAEYGRVNLEEFHLDAITGGTNALAEVTLKISERDKSMFSRAVHEDVVMASVNAFINGLNRLFQDI
jgi:2-isopropylmalate synthase